MRTGAVVGYLLWFTANFMFLAVSNVGNVMSTLVDPLLELVPGAFAGGMVAAVLRAVSVAGSPKTASESRF
jgi:hypothetical protein